jgi:flagellar motor protein MotB
MFKRVVVLATLGLAVLTIGTGCSNKPNAERQSLINQNKDLAARAEAAERARAEAEQRAASLANSQVNSAPTEGPSTPSMGEDPLSSDNPPSIPGARTTSSSGGGSTRIDTGVSTSKNRFGQNVIEISGEVLFDSGKAALKPAAKRSLDKVAALIKQKYSGQRLRVEGHTDPNPVRSSGWDDNYDLGHARARAVLLYLKSKGIPEKNMYSASFAATQMKSTKNMALNRRVDIVVVNSGK